jgi:CspA family cold shock protein
MNDEVKIVSDEKPTHIGRVIWFSGAKGYGFLAWEIDGVAQRDIFCHYSDILAQGYKTLNKEQRVSFQIGVNHHGDPKAILVTVIPD